MWCWWLRLENDLSCMVSRSKIQPVETSMRRLPAQSLQPILIIPSTLCSSPPRGPPSHAWQGRMHQGKWDGYRRLSGLAVALGLDFPQYGGAGAAAGSGGYSGGGWPARGSGSSGGGRVPPRGLRRATMPHKRET